MPPPPQVRTVHYKYFHPKEALISDGVLNRALLDAAGSNAKSRLAATGGDDLDGTIGALSRGREFDGTGLDFVYPSGATLAVQKPAVALLSSGKIAYPMHQPLAAMWSQARGGRRAAVALPCLWVSVASWGAVLFCEAARQRGCWRGVPAGCSCARSQSSFAGLQGRRPCKLLL